MSAPLSIRQLNKALPYLESIRSIGKIQWGVASKKISLPLMNAKESHSKTPRVTSNKQIAPNSGNQQKPQNAEKQALLAAEKKSNETHLKEVSYNTQKYRNAAVYSVIKEILVNANENQIECFKNELLNASPIEMLNQNGNDSRKIGAYLQILSLPIGSQILLQNKNLDSMQKLLLETLAKAYVAAGTNESFADTLNAAKRAVNDVLGRSKLTIAKMALVAAHHELTTGQHHANRWAIAAFNNGFTEEIGANGEFKKGGELERIEQRIHKMVRWAKRAERRSAWSRLLPNYKKSPFRALRMGYRGANQGGHEVGNTQASKPTERSGEFTKLKDKKHKNGIYGVTEALHHLVDTIQGASRYRALSGGAYGVGTKGISGVFSQLLTGFLFRFRVILAVTHPRLAGIEVAMPAYNMELMLYSQKNHQKQAGLGASVGPSFGPLEIACGLDVNAYQSEHKQFDGVVLRLPRVRGQENKLRADFKEILSSVMAYGDLKPNGILLKTLLANHPELSISLMDTAHEQRTSHSIKVFGQAGIRAGIAKIYAGVSGEVNYLSNAERVQHDVKGQLQVSKQIIARGFEINGGAGAEFRLGSSSDATRANLLNMDVMSVEWGLARAGRQLRRDIVQHRGRYSTDSFVEVEYQSLNDFEAAIKARKHQWVNARALRKKILHSEAEEHIDDFIRQVKSAHRPGLIYAARYELRAERAQQLNALESLKLLHPEDKSHFDSQIQNILNDPQSYSPTSFRMFDRQEAGAEFGVDAVLTAKTIDKVEAVHVPIRMM